MGFCGVNQKSVLETHPSVVEIWHLTKNLPITLNEVSYGMGK